MSDTSFADSAHYTPATLQRKRALAEAMLQSGMQTTPISSPWQGLARLAQAGVGAWQTSQLDAQERAQAKSDAALMSQLFGGQPAATASPAPIIAVPSSTSAGSVASPGYIANVAQAESGGNPTATNPRSTATGSGQFIDSTWLDLMGKYHPEMVKGKTPAEILAMRTNSDLSNEMIGDYAKENAPKLAAAGIQPTESNLYVAHVFGPGGAAALIKAPQGASAASIVGPDVMKANPWIGNRSAQDVVSLVGGKVEQPAAAAAPAGNMLSPSGVEAAPKAQLAIAARLSMSGDPRKAALGNAIISKAITANSNLPPELQEYGFYQRQAIQSGQQPMSYSDWDLQRRGAAASRTNINMGENKLRGALGEGIGKEILSGHQAAQEAVQSIQANNQARKLLDSGVVTGFGANIKLAFGKALQQAGINVADDPIANTEAFVAQRAQETGRIIKQFGSGTGLSDADRQYAMRAVAGDVTLNESSIRKILDLNERASRFLIDRNNTNVGKLKPGTVDYDLSIQAPEPYAPAKTSEKVASPTAPTDALAQARAAIAQGAPRDAVIKRLQENGIDTSGL